MTTMNGARVVYVSGPFFTFSNIYIYRLHVLPQRVHDHQPPRDADTSRGPGTFIYIYCTYDYLQLHNRQSRYHPTNEWNANDGFRTTTKGLETHTCLEAQVYFFIFINILNSYIDYNYGCHHYLTATTTTTCRMYLYFHTCLVLDMLS